MSLFQQACDFLRVNSRVTEPQFTLQDGYFLCPNSISNNEAEKLKIILHYSFLDIYKIKHTKVVEAVEYFMKLNGIHFNPLDNNRFSIYLAVLCYCIAFYKRRIEYADVKSIGLKWGNVEKYITKSEIEKMYAGLFLYLTREKGLSDKTAEEIMYSCDAEKAHGIENVLTILNNLERKYHPETNTSMAILKKRLVYDITEFQRLNPLSNSIGNEMEACVKKELDYIKTQLLRIYGSTSCIVLDMDTDRTIKAVFKKKKGIKVPDFLYLDGKWNVAALDSKFNLGYAKPEQVGRANLAVVLTEIDFQNKVLSCLGAA